MHGNEDFSYKLELILMYIKEMISFQKEMFAFMQAIDERMPVPEKTSFYRSVSFNKDWLDAYEAKELLQVGDLTLRRRRQEGTFIAKKIGKKWFYLRSSLQ